MKKLWLLLIALALSYPVAAQQKTPLTATSASCATANSCLIYGVDSTSGAVTITISTSSTGSWTAQFEKSGDARSISDTTATWVAASSTDATPISSATGSGSWQFNVAAYTAVRVRLSAYSSGSAVVSIIPSTASARSGGGGGGAGTVTNVTGSAPIASSGGTTPAISCATCVTSAASLTSGEFMEGAGLQASATTAHLDDGVTTAATITSSEPIAVTPDGTHPGSLYLACQTTLPSLTANGVTLLGCPGASNTAWSLQMPTAIPVTTDLFECVVTTTNCLFTDSGIPVTSHTIPISAVGSSGLSGTAPITISAAGAIACATCNTSAASITSNVLPKGSGGAQGLANSSITDNGTSVSTAENILATGIVDGVAPITITTGTTGNLGTTYHSGYTLNQEATAGTGVTYTLPATVTGDQYCVSNSGTTGVVNIGVLTVYPPSSSFVILNGVVNTVGGGGTHGVASGGAAGDAACFVAIDATHWQVFVGKGTWAEN